MLNWRRGRRPKFAAPSPKEFVLGFLHSPWFMRLRVGLAITVLMSAALLSSYALLKRTRPLPQSAGRDEVSAYEVRFVRLKQFLPGNGTVCYVPDYTSSETAKKDFFLARYALAPLVVRNVPDCDPLIGDFPSRAPASALSNKYTVLEDFGNGLLLLKRNER